MTRQKKKINIKSVGIILKPKIITDYVSILPNLVSWLKRRKIKIYFDEAEAQRIDQIFKSKSTSAEFIDLKSLHRDMDLNITLGGDGTLLGFGRLSERNSAPIFGVNMGNLGFITEFPKAEFFEELSILLKGKCEIKKHPLFKVQVHKRNKKTFESHYLNDLVINKNDISRMFSLAIENQDEHIFNISGDGLILSSPIGSTAYSLAAGGPIISNEVPALVLTPICPHSLTHRPIVISDRDTIKIKVPAGSESVTLTLDGQQVFSLGPRSVITITRSRSRFLKLVTNPERTYFQTLKEKFTYGRRTI